MKYFITGATGFIGGRLARQLREAGHEVIAVVRNPAKAQELAQLGVTLHQGDVTEKESMRKPMTGVDGVFHVAGWYKVGVRDKSQAYAINVQGTRNVLELMKELNIPKGVYTSTLAVNSDTRGVEADENYHFTGKHISVYDQTKADAHDVAIKMIKEGLPLVIVQPGLVYGPEDTSSVRTSLTQYLTKQLPVMPKQTAFSWGYIDDITHAHWLAMEKGKIGENYNICGPTHTFINALEIANQITGIKLPMAVPAGMIRTMSAMMYLFDKFIPVPESYTGEGLRVIAGATYIGSNAKAKRELGYDPRPLKDGLEITLKHEMKLLGL
ncbi:NAD-dependent epimerase/dehydratase family protein [Candidatus Villigracilis affinis]|uniref:NAD-dependent epimerase/dehydratase family protein n=1 Tax=Candidatus Villigracilis affinis TaxID=3140682 RepID=UPI002A1B3B33|nr:NAD-dependent epimerase/dehydratase family protein [Anaerolineales bacterium]